MADRMLILDDLMTYKAVISFFLRNKMSDIYNLITIP